jgi:hypothetical protein
MSEYLHNFMYHQKATLITSATKFTLLKLPYSLNRRRKKMQLVRENVNHKDESISLMDSPYFFNDMVSTTPRFCFLPHFISIQVINILAKVAKNPSHAPIKKLSQKQNLSNSKVLSTFNMRPSVTLSKLLKFL